MNKIALWKNKCSSLRNKTTFARNKTLFLLNAMFLAQTRFCSGKYGRIGAGYNRVSGERVLFGTDETFAGRIGFRLTLNELQSSVMGFCLGYSSLKTLRSYL